jgi:hypothetical protein
LRESYDQLTELVPSLREASRGAYRKEAVILQKTVEYMKELLIERYTLASEIRNLNVALGQPDAVVDSVISMVTSHC